MKLLKLDIASSASFFLYAASAVLTPVSLVEISRDFPINFTASGGIETARTLLVLFVLVASGSITRKTGKKPLLVTGLLIMAAGMFSFSLSRSYIHILFSMMIIGVGGGFTEALVNPLIKELHPENAGEYLNITNAFYSVGITVTVLGSGILLSRGISWRLLFLITGGASLGAALLFMSAPFPGYSREKEEASFMTTVKQRGFATFGIAIFLAGGLEAAFVFWLSGYVQHYFLGTVKTGAYAIALFGGTMAAGRFLTGKLSLRFPLKKIMYGSVVLGFLASLTLFKIATVTQFFIVITLAGFATSSFWPSILAEASEKLKNSSTSLFVLLAGLGILGYGFTPLFIGFAGDIFGLHYGFLIVPLWYICLGTILMVEKHFSNCT